MFRNGLQAWHIITLIVVLVLLFGANRLPGLARSVGESLKIFKKEIKDLSGDDGTTVGTPAGPADASPVTPVTPVPPVSPVTPADPNGPKA